MDLEQYKALKDFEKRMQKIGLTGAYNNLTDFREQLFNQLSINVRNLIDGKPVVAPTAKEAKAKVSSIVKIAKAGKVHMEDYEKDGVVKAFVVKGDTKPIKEGLKGLGGRWNGTLEGWIFPKSRELEIAEFLKAQAAI
ncbi:hypothetical protein [Brevundimonas sp. NIBR11]|uniref:hypothetical protein n=1 Tax=Brevundimonas sp. NIBR11 TaxID=3015999 RepID=UPI0022EFEF79|nr:hypothetical protein [Brevundimonas sp. NIBR11]